MHVLWMSSTEDKTGGVIMLYAFLLPHVQPSSYSQRHCRCHSHITIIPPKRQWYIVHLYHSHSLTNKQQSFSNRRLLFLHKKDGINKYTCIWSGIPYVLQPFFIRKHFTIKRKRCMGTIVTILTMYNKCKEIQSIGSESTGWPSRHSWKHDQKR